MYLSKVQLSWNQTRNPYEQHRALWQLFPNSPEAQRSFLYRIEQTVKGQGADVLMQSLQSPVETGDVNLVATRDFNPSLYQGQVLRFRLRANPVKTIKDPRKGERIKNGKTYTRTVRVPLILEAQQQAWLEKKLKDSASLQSLVVQQELPLNFRKKSEKCSGKIQPILFDGILTVEDSEALLELMKYGIGPAKSFGCGMLSLRAV
ncbi:MAG: type I-E CRISPR-associated protein Cas6/Cse3/CasE [Proteobacteria bacterium]|nr:MAG: type I-E CRISPR-associated protein Cas6/Cse3/CasE [Pseudomonadota bacterium]PIE40210.1 MAG: type I-E CRISPR-associated protein Cas6/Cse3/CasE [Gammaproteobacteria bacterium]